MMMTNVRRAGCVLLAVVLLFAGCGGKSELDGEETRLLAFGAVLATRNSMHYNDLYGVSKLSSVLMPANLEQSWGITGRESAIESLDWLREEGHRLSLDEDYYGFDDIWWIVAGFTGGTEAEYEYFGEEIQSCANVYWALSEDYGVDEAVLDGVTTVSAWDYDRLVTVARWCYGCEYITEDEAWAYISWAAERAVEDYDSWEAYFAGVLLGRAIWSPEGDFPEDDRAVADVLLAGDSIYRNCSFGQ